MSQIHSADKVAQAIKVVKMAEEQQETLDMVVHMCSPMAEGQKLLVVLINSIAFSYLQPTILWLKYQLNGSNKK